MKTKVSVAEGKYTVVFDEDGGLKALRYGEEWRDCCGDNLVYCLASELHELRQWAKECRDNILYPLACHSVGHFGEVAEGLGSTLKDLMTRR